MGFRQHLKIENLILDVDGVLTTGHMGYTDQGKFFKVFGPHDREGLKIISKYIPNIKFITADQSGFRISYVRIIDDWGFNPRQLLLISEEERLDWFERTLPLDKTAYIADGYSDAAILKKVAIGIAPANARIEARNAADYVTPSNSAEGAVMDACLYLKNLIDNETI